MVATDPENLNGDEMRKLGFVVLAFSALGGCSSSVDAPQADPTAGVGVTQAQLRAFDRLTQESGRSWTWAQHETWRTPSHVASDRTGAPLLAKGATEAEVERVTHGFLARYRDLFKMRDPSSELRLSRIEVDALTMTHARFRQTVQGVPVVGAELMAHYDASGRLTSIDANYIPGISDVDVAPKLDAKVAAIVAKEDVLSRMPDVTDADLEIEAPKLVVFALGEHPATLAYEVTTHAMAGARPAIWVETIDAKTGTVVHRFDNLQTIEATGRGVLGDSKKFQVAQTAGSYVMTDTSRGVSIQTFSAAGQQVQAGGGAQAVTSTALTSWDTTGAGPGAAVDAHTHAGVVFDYYKTKHARNAIDGAGGAMLSTAHYGAAYENAAWTGRGMIYGDGGSLFRPLSAGLDVCAHEFTHGVTQVTSGLRYEGQPGALNESVSDIFGAFIEHSYAADEAKNWTIGESIARQAGLVRDFRTPSVGSQPSNMTKYVNTQQDNGGVHINSGIPNNAAYLMTLGGTNPTSGAKVAFGIGWDKSEKLWYRTSTHYLLETSTFAQAAQATMEAAKDVALTANEQNIVDCAWKATGVVLGQCAPITDPLGATPASTPSGSGEEEASGEQEAAPAKPPARRTTTTTENGCSAAPQRSDLGVGFGVFAAIGGLALGRRRRTRRS